MKILIILGLLLPTMVVANCQYHSLSFRVVKKTHTSTADYRGYNFKLEGSDDGHSSFEGPLTISKGKKKICSLKQGLFQPVMHVEKNLGYLLVKTYSGSCGEYRIYDLNNCAEISSASPYCGNAVFNGRTLIANSHCEVVNEKEHKFKCSSARVYELSMACVFEFNVDATNKLTLSEVGETLPLNGTKEIIRK